MIDIKTENKLKNRLFRLLSDLEIHTIKEKDLIDNYDFRKHPPIIRLLIKNLVEQGFIKSHGSSFSHLEINSSLGLEVLRIGSWTKYLKSLKKQSKDKNVHIEKLIVKDNVISRDNNGIQSLKSDLYNPIIENDIPRPISKAVDIWTFKNIMFAIITGLIVSCIIYIISLF
ncbi:hypothetical protein [Lutibacter sp.]|uniref:hypothetical protein n=1 Tax=Lutibacter sp. TaxID=1925666 RepID=UPI00273722B2|nr:hypothetical protein [Lutibacter sp.]MDP3313775.1 hypothetical protein [Lutibacter sp.]